MAKKNQNEFFRFEMVIGPQHTGNSNYAFATYF
jgi:hypothetical protein